MNHTWSTNYNDAEGRRSYGKEWDVTDHTYWFRKTAKHSGFYCKQTILMQVLYALIIRAKDRMF